MLRIIQEHVFLAASLAATAFAGFIFFVFLQLNKKSKSSRYASNQNKPPLAAGNIRAQRVRAEDRLSEAKASFHVGAQPIGEQVHFRTIGSSNMLEALIYVEALNSGPYAITIERVNWDLWRSGLHIKSGLFTDKVTLEPNGEKKQIIFRELVQNSESIGLGAGSQTGTDGYLEGLMSCQTEFGRFKKSFTILDLQFSISEDAILKLNSSVSQNYLDGLTGLLERKFLEENLQNIINRNADGNHLSFVMVDIDNFKFINDTYGHLAGDEVIRAVCDTIKSLVSDRGLCIRYGGDEFAIVLQNCTLNDAKNLFEKIRESVEGYAYSLPEIKSTISIGIATITEAVEFKTLIKNADDVLRVSKETGKNRVTINQRKIRNDAL